MGFFRRRLESFDRGMSSIPDWTFSGTTWARRRGDFARVAEVRGNWGWHGEALGVHPSPLTSASDVAEMDRDSRKEPSRLKLPDHWEDEQDVTPDERLEKWTNKLELADVGAPATGCFLPAEATTDWLGALGSLAGGGLASGSLSGGGLASGGPTDGSLAGRGLAGHVEEKLSLDPEPGTASSSRPTEDFGRFRKSIEKTSGRHERKQKRGARTNASTYCHVCGRQGYGNSLVVCSNFYIGRCQKVVCQFCFLRHQFGDFSKAQVKENAWVCPHCTETCPEAARCFMYQAANERRKFRRSLKKSSAAEKKNSASR